MLCFLYSSGRPAFVSLRLVNGICPASVSQRAFDNFSIPACGRQAACFLCGTPLSNYLFPPYNGGILNSAVDLDRFARKVQPNWKSGRRDLNPRPLAPQASALAGLRHVPKKNQGFKISYLSKNTIKTDPLLTTLVTKR